MNGIGDFFHELRRRKVFQTAALYIVAAWVILQVADLAFPGLGVPEEAIRFVWIGAFVGFPLALLFAWRYQITRQGIVRTAPLDAGDAADLALKRPDYLILGVLFLVVGGVTYQLITEIRQVPVPVRLAPLAREILPNSIAVLPLQNVTGDPEQEYFVAGMHDALITDLSKISALKVISRGSANVYKNIVQPVRQTGLELGVANVIEGSVFRTGDQVRINVQLIDTGTDENLWSESYERDIRDVLALQGEVARAIAEKIRVKLTPEEETRLASAREVDPETYEAYLKGMFHLKQYTPEGIQKGLQYLHEAVEKDPENAQAYAGLALGYITIGHGIGRDAFPKALVAARRALELDEYSGEAWAALAEAQLYYDWDWEASEESVKRALQLSPSLDHVRAHYAYLLALLGRWDESFAEAEKARQLSPLDATWAAFASWLYMLEERYDEAYAAANESLELAPDMPLGINVLGHILTSQGRFEEAIEVQEKIPRDSPFSNWTLGPTYAMAGRDAEARQIAAAMAEDPGPKDKLFLAFIYAGLGENDEAMLWLESCYETRVDWLPWIANLNAFGGVLEPMRDDPRFQALITKLNLQDFRKK